MDDVRPDPVAILQASGPDLHRCIELALVQLQRWARQQGNALDGPTRERLPLDALLWDMFLTQSRDGIYKQTAPSMPRGHLDTPQKLPLTELRFFQFQRWFQKEILADLRRYLADNDGRLIRMHRVSTRQGGDRADAEARYFLTFAEFVPPPKQKRRAQALKPRVIQAEPSAESITQQPPAPAVGQAATGRPFIPQGTDSGRPMDGAPSKGDEHNQPPKEAASGEGAGGSQGKQEQSDSNRAASSDAKASRESSGSSLTALEALLLSESRSRVQTNVATSPIASAALLAVLVVMVVSTSPFADFAAVLTQVLGRLADVAGGTWHIVF